MEYEWDQKKGFRPSPDLSDIQIFLAQMKRKNSLFMLIGILVWIVNFLGIFFLPNLFSCYVLPGPHHTEWWSASRKVKPSLHGICLGEKGLWLWVYYRHDRFTSYLRLLRTKASNLSLWKGKERCESHSTWKERNLRRAELQLQHSFPPIWGLACFHWWRAKGAPEVPSIRVSSRRRSSPRGLGDRLNPHS